MKVEIWTDGACRGNPGPGGWAAVIVEEGREPRELSGGEPDTTNNRMELMAAIRGLEVIGDDQSAVIYTDSKYVCDGITSWVAGWKRRNWKTASGTPVLNRPLWERLDALCAGRRISWKWVKGHSGNPNNERCDVLAVAAARQF